MLDKEALTTTVASLGNAYISYLKVSAIAGAVIVLVALAVFLVWHKKTNQPTQFTTAEEVEFEEVDN